MQRPGRQTCIRELRRLLIVMMSSAIPTWSCIGLTLLITALTMTPGAVAAPSWGDTFTLEQPDGTEVPVRIWGDEFYRVVESPDGYTLVRDPQSGIICYAVVSGDGRELESTGVRFDTIPGDGLGIDKHVRINREAAQARIDAARAEAAAHEREVLAGMGDRADRIEPTTVGYVQGITLIIDFSDRPATIPAGSVLDFCNQLGFTGYGNNGSVRDYFHDVSDGLLTYTNYVPVAYYRADRPLSYYDDCSAPYGSRARELIVEALNDLDSQGFDFSRYDSNGDGFIDALNCFYAGYTQCGWAQGLWPHAGVIDWSADRVSTFRYQITGMGGSLALGIFCHENGHMLCWWPDLYDYDGDSRGVGFFCMMCSITSSTNPQEPCAAMKDYANWCNVIELDVAHTGLVVPSTENTIYRYSHPNNSHEYYLIENRQQAGRDVFIPDHGLAIWHVDSLYGNNSNQQQTPALHYEVTLVQADGRWDMENDVNSGDGTDLYAAPEYTECSPRTYPNTNWWDGSQSSLAIMDVSDSGVDMTFTFYPDGEPPVAVPDGFATRAPYFLYPNRPNPFNPHTTIAYELLERHAVTVRIFDLAGRLVDVLVEVDTVPAGTYTATWTGRDSQGRAMPSGSYFYRLEVDGFAETRRMTLIR